MAESPFRPVTIEDTRVVTHEAAVCPNCSHDEHHGECTRWVANLSGGRLCGCTQPAPAAAAPSEAREETDVFLTSEEYASICRDLGIMEDNVRHYRKHGDDLLAQLTEVTAELASLRARLATAEAERDQWRARAEWLSTSTDEVCYVEPVGDYEGGWHILAVPGFYATRWEAIDAATRRAPSTGTTPP